MLKYQSYLQFQCTVAGFHFLFFARILVGILIVEILVEQVGEPVVEHHSDSDAGIVVEHLLGDRRAESVVLIMLNTIEELAA